MTPFAALRASVVFPLGLMLVLLGPYCATAVFAAPRHALSASRGTGQDDKGKALYREHCKLCHGVSGTPPKLMVKRFAKIPDLSHPAFFSTRSDDSLMVVLQKGTGVSMKSFSEKLSTDEMHAIVKYLRTLAEPH